MSYTVEQEQVSQSQHSPGIIAPDELLLRLGFEPEHIVDGQIIPNAISSADLKSRGFSIYRQKFAKPDHIRGLAMAQASRLVESKGVPQEPMLSVFQCNSVRKILFTEACPEVSGERAIVVLDMAEAENIAHAALYSTSQRPRDIKWIKNKLVDVLNNLVQLDKHLEQVFSA